MQLSVYAIVILVGILLFAGVIALIVSLCSRSKGTQVLPAGEGSCFDGNTWQLIGWTLLGTLLSAITLGIAYPWVQCMIFRWEAKHTVINGRRLRFTGKGLQLLGKSLLWLLLTVVTLGIFGLFLGLKLKQWQVKHTVYADDEKPVESFFSGRAGGYLGIHLLAGLLTLVTLGIGAAWAQKMILAWEARHTHIGGSPMEFNGTGGQLFVKYLLWGLLTVVTLGIFALFIPVGMRKWKYAHTDAVYQTKRIREQSRAHEASAVADYARFHLAANDTELAQLRSGIENVTDPEELSRLAQGGDPYAQYRMALLQKGENDEFTGEALAYLKASSDGLYHPAMHAYALTLPAQEQRKLLEAAAARGSSAAPWLLAQQYAAMPGKLQTRAYWFKVAMEWADPEALARQEEYEKLVTAIALQLSENQPKPKGSAAAAVAAAVGILAGLLVIGAFAAVMLFNIPTSPKAVENLPVNTEPGYSDEVTPGGENGAWTEEPAVTEPAQEAPVGEWWSLEYFDKSYVHEIRLELMEDGGFAMSDTLYSEGSESNAEIRVFDRYWVADGGGGSSGTYTYANGILTFHRPADIQNSESSWFWEVEQTPEGIRCTSPERGLTWQFVPGTQPDYEATNSAQANAAADLARQLEGNWSTAYRGGNVISLYFITFHSDGTFTSHSQEYEHGSFTHFMDYTDWYLAPMGYPLFEGVYSVEQSADGQCVLTMRHTAMDGFPLSESSYSWPVAYVDKSSGRANFDGREYVLGTYGFEELCRMLIVDTSVPTG